MRITNGYGNATRPYIKMEYKPIGKVMREGKQHYAIKCDKSICSHIKKAFIAKTIVNQTNYDIEVPNWAKNLFGKNYYKNALIL